MTQTDPTPIDDGITDVEVKPSFKQRQVQRLMRAFKITLDFFERIVEFASPQSAVDTTASSSTHDLHAPLNARWSIRVMVGGILLLLL